MTTLTSKDAIRGTLCPSYPLGSGMFRPTGPEYSFFRKENAFGRGDRIPTLQESEFVRTWSSAAVLPQALLVVPLS